MAFAYSVRLRRWSDARPGFGLADRVACERGLERRREAVERGLVGPRHPLRRHHAAAELPHDFFPGSPRRPGCRARSILSSTSPPTLARSLWQVTQYWVISARCDADVGGWAMRTGCRRTWDAPRLATSK